MLNSYLAIVLWPLQLSRRDILSDKAGAVFPRPHGGRATTTESSSNNRILGGLAAAPSPRCKGEGGTRPPPPPPLRRLMCFRLILLPVSAHLSTSLCSLRTAGDGRGRFRQTRGLGYRAPPHVNEQRPWSGRGLRSYLLMFSSELKTT